MPPVHIREAAKAALDRGETHYTARPGVPELRAAIARRSTEDGYPATTEGTVVTNGGAEALYIALQSTLRPGRRAAGWFADSAERRRRWSNSSVRGCERLALDGERFAPNAAQLRKAEGKVLLLASPSPITGLEISQGDLAGIVETAVEAGTDRHRRSLGGVVLLRSDDGTVP